MKASPAYDLGVRSSRGTSHYHAHNSQVPTYRIPAPDVGATSDLTVLERNDLILESPPVFKDPFESRLVNRPDRILGTFSVVAITFLYACGGPLGSEPIVSIGGPLVGLLGLIVYPIVYTVPYAAVVTELSAAFPEDGGFTIWILNAFGPFWAVQVGYWSWIAGALSIAIYPSYILDTVARFTEFHPSQEYLIKATIAITLSTPALIGTKCLSRLTSLLLITVLMPVLLFTVWGFAEFDASAAGNLGVVRRANTTVIETTGRVEQTGDASIDWYELINTLYWNYEGLRMASVFGGQVANPTFVYKRAIWIVVGLTASCYILPLLASIVSGGQPWAIFDRGTYELAALAVGGNALRGIMTTCSFATCIGLHICGMFCCSTEISGMAENKLLPVAIAMRNAPCGSPHYAILSTLVLVLALMALDIDELLPVANTFGSLVAASIFVSAVQLRRNMPYVTRPVKVPGGVIVLSLVSVLPVGLCGYIIVKTLISSLQSALLVLGFLSPAVIVGVAQALVCKRGMIK